MNEEYFQSSHYYNIIIAIVSQGGGRGVLPNPSGEHHLYPSEAGGGVGACWGGYC